MSSLAWAAADVAKGTTRRRSAAAAKASLSAISGGGGETKDDIAVGSGIRA